jgi:hypothetical protein
LQPVAQSDARDRETAAGVVEQARQELASLLLDGGQVRGEVGRYAPSSATRRVGMCRRV